MAIELMSFSASGVNLLKNSPANRAWVPLHATTFCIVAISLLLTAYFLRFAALDVFGERLGPNCSCDHLRVRLFVNSTKKFCGACIRIRYSSQIDYKPLTRNARCRFHPDPA